MVVAMATPTTPQWNNATNRMSRTILRSDAITKKEIIKNAYTETMKLSKKEWEINGVELKGVKQGYDKTTKVISALNDGTNPAE